MKNKFLEIKEVVKEFPTLSGVYLMKDQNTTIIYIGKAKNLRNRVSSYFNSSKGKSPKTRRLVQKIQTIEYIVTASESEAFLVEATLIKKHKPHYNIRLKDDRSYPYIKISMYEDFPKISLARRVLKDKAQYFGPFTSSFLVRNSIKYLNQSFKIRDCSNSFMNSRKRACITYEIDRCTAPCVDNVDKQYYSHQVLGVINFLNGKNKNIFKDLEKNMYLHSEKEEFELAARKRDDFNNLRSILEKQTVVKDSKTDLDVDVFTMVIKDNYFLLECVNFRKGRVIGNRNFFFKGFSDIDFDKASEEVMSMLMQYYTDNIIPDELILDFDIDHEIRKILEKSLKTLKEARVEVILAPRTWRKDLVLMARKNAQVHIERRLAQSKKSEEALNSIQRKFHLKEIPEKIECYDISHFQGKDTVASKVTLLNGELNRSNYRMYKLKTVTGIDDYKSMKEVLTRRFQHFEDSFPSLILIDGGKGQLSAAKMILDELNLNIPLASIAKARTTGTFSDQEISRTEERFYLPNRKNPVLFRENSEAYRLLVTLRNESHRFAISFNRKLRGKNLTKSELDEISGIGDKRKKILINSFNTIEEIKKATLKELSQVKGFDKKSAQNVFDYFQNNK